MSKWKVWRDDDISCKTDLDQFKKAHKFFEDAVVMHTIALICKDIEKAPELIDYIKCKNIDVQVHCWEHYDLTTDIEQAEKDLFKCCEHIKYHFGEYPETLYPPWNISSPDLRSVAKNFGLRVSTKKVSLDQYIRFSGGVEEKVINFHYWSDEEVNQLQEALRIYNEIR